MSKPPEEPKKLRTWPEVFTALAKAITGLGAHWYRDEKGRLRATTPDGKVCCPVTLIALHRLNTFVPAERVSALFRPDTSRGRPMSNDLAVDLILTADNRTTDGRTPNPEIRASLDNICKVEAMQEASIGGGI